MPAVTYKCPACGGSLAYDPADNKFACSFCDSHYDENQLTKSATDAPEQVNDAVVYSCPSCGAQVVATDTTAATFCYFCHNPVVLEGRVSEEWTPDGVLPFKIAKEEAINRFLKWAKKKKFVPVHFSAMKSVESISGVYYPYWLTDVESDAAFEGKGKQVSTHTTAKYIVTTTKHYQVGRRGTAQFKNICRSALSTANRTLADGVQPYTLSSVVPFSPKYLAGFLAEKRNVESDTLKASLLEETTKYTDKLLRPNGEYDVVTGSTSVQKTLFRHKYVLLPAWVVTYKDPAGKIDYYIVNGQGGATCGVLPVSWPKLIGTAAMLCALLFAIICVGGYFLW